MRTRFGSRGTRNDIRQVGISGTIQTRGMDNILPVQLGSDKNHLSVDQMNRSTGRRLRYILGYTFFSKNVTFRNVGLTAFRGISLQVTYFFYILKIYI